MSIVKKADDKYEGTYEEIIRTIKNDIPTLHLLGAKKWWKEKHLLQFGIEFCDLSKKEAKSFYDECVEAKSNMLKELSEKFDDVAVLFK